MEYTEEGIDDDSDGPIGKVTVYRDDEPIGFIQKLDLHIDSEIFWPRQFEITFPDFRGADWSDVDALIQKINAQVEFLSRIPGVNVVLKRP